MKNVSNSEHSPLQGLYRGNDERCGSAHRVIYLWRVQMKFSLKNNPDGMGHRMIKEIGFDGFRFMSGAILC